MSGFVLGFIAGEGCFKVDVGQSSRNPDRTTVRPRFSLLLNKRDRELLEEIQNDLGNVGGITQTGDEISLQVGSKEDLQRIVSFIEKYTSKTWEHSQKSRQFDIWKEIVSIYADGRTTVEQKLKMLQKAKLLESSGRSRETSIDEHIGRVEKRISNQ